mgnify:CR=1 FL=1
MVIFPIPTCEFWRKKIERNRQRDERNKGELKKLGWRVMTVVGVPIEAGGEAADVVGD